MVDAEAMSFQDWLCDKPIDWKLFRYEEMHYEMWEDYFIRKED